MNNKKSSPAISSQAAKTLGNPSASKTAKQLAGSALSQSAANKQTGKEMEAKASAVLLSPKYSSETKSLAASVLSQSNNNR